MEKVNGGTRKVKKMILALVLLLAVCGCTAQTTNLQQAEQAYTGQDYQKASQFYQQAALAGQGVSAWRGLVNSLTKLADQSEQGLDDMIVAYEGLYRADGFETADFALLAGLYARAGRYADQRDMLEKEYRLQPAAETMNTLNHLTVTATADSQPISDAIAALAAQLAGSDIDSAAVTCCDSSLFELLFPKLSSGHRRYIYTDQNTKGILRIEAGYNSQQTRYVYCWYDCGDGTAVYIGCLGGSILTVAEGRLTAGSYDGPLSVWCCNAIDGSIINDKITISAGCCQGSIASYVSSGNSQKTAAELWAARTGAAAVEYNGTFNTSGTTAEKQQTAVTGASGIVYAYNKEATKFIYLTAIGSTAADYIFRPAALGVADFPVWQAGSDE